MMIVITGHMGFVGRHLIRAMGPAHASVVGIDLKIGFDVLECNLPMNDEVTRVYHLAAQTDAQSTDVLENERVNVEGTLRMLEHYGSKVVFASTSMVNYPITPYAISKRAAEDYALMRGAAVVRFCNLYGEGGHSAWDKFRDGDSILIRGSGDQVRTYAPVEKGVRALLDAKPGVLTILGGTEFTVNQLADMYPDKPRTHVPPRPMDVVCGAQLNQTYVESTFA